MFSRLGGGGRSWAGCSAAALLVLGLVPGWTSNCGAQENAPAIDGRELFTREWIPGDPRSHGGDGLGPVFNDTSCVACHNQGGVGGTGPAAKNAQIISAFSNGAQTDQMVPTSLVGLLVTVFGGTRATAPQPAANGGEVSQAVMEQQRQAIAKIHPGFRTARSVVLHRSSTVSDYAQFRGKLTGLSNFEGFQGVGVFGAAVANRGGEPGPSLSTAQQSELNRLKAEAQFASARAFSGGATIGGFTFLLSERNTVPLFGSGKIGAIPDKVLVAAAEKKYDDYPEVSGRVAKLKNGWIGRFGWKAQKARLSDFVLTACAVEIGLNVPGEPQSGMPQNPDYKAPGLDLNQQECDALISFVGNLPAPKERTPANREEAEYLDEGRKLFATAGCAACHTPQLGEVVGIYSDLLLHDMGRELSDSGSYAGFAPNATEEEELKQPLPALTTLTEQSKPVDESNLIGATRQEWRTPPLWGLRDSAPYLHDGRAATIEQAIAMHGGEGTRAVRNFMKLDPSQRLQLTLFLRSLVAPD